MFHVCNYHDKDGNDISNDDTCQTISKSSILPTEEDYTSFASGLVI